MCRAGQEPAGRQQIGRMKHRRGMQEHVVGARALRETKGKAIGNDIGVAQPDALGAARGAAGVIQDRVVIGPGLGGIGYAGVGKEIVIGGPGHGRLGVAERDPPDGPAGDLGCLVGSGEPTIGEYGPTLGIVEDMGDFRWRETPVDGNRDRALAKAGPTQLLETRPVQGVDGEPVAPSDAEFGENAGGTRDAGAEFAPGQKLVTVDDRRGTAVVADVARQRLRQRQHRSPRPDHREVQSSAARSGRKLFGCPRRSARPPFIPRETRR